MSAFGGKADIEAKLLTRGRGEADCGEHRQAAGAIAEDLSRKSAGANAPAVKREAEEDWGR